MRVILVGVKDQDVFRPVFVRQDQIVVKFFFRFEVRRLSIRPRDHDAPIPVLNVGGASTECHIQGSAVVPSELCKNHVVSRFVVKPEKCVI
jgi:hypothetical protein